MSPVVGIGTDIVDVERLRLALRRSGDRFVERVFTEAEAAYCRGRPDPALHFAGRFAAKEAVLKALGSGWARGVGWRDVEVALGDGPPEVRLSGRARELAESLGARDPVRISISHVRAFAVAFAVVEGKDG